MNIINDISRQIGRALSNPEQVASTLSEYVNYVANDYLKDVRNSFEGNVSVTGKSLMQKAKNISKDIANNATDKNREKTIEKAAKAVIIAALVSLAVAAFFALFVSAKVGIVLGLLTVAPLAVAIHSATMFNERRRV